MTDLERKELEELGRLLADLQEAQRYLWEADDLLQCIAEPFQAMARGGLKESLAQVERQLAAFPVERHEELQKLKAAEDEEAFQAERRKYQAVVNRIHAEERSRTKRLDRKYQ